MWKFSRGGATVIPGATLIPESRVAAQMDQTEEFMFQNVTYRPTVYKTGESGFVCMIHADWGEYLCLFELW